MGQQQMEHPRPALRQTTRPGVLDRERPAAQQIAQRPSWTPLLASAGATVLLIALLAGLLVSQAERRPTTAAVPTATTGAATSTPSDDQWHGIDSYTHVPGLLLAPSDPRTAYQSQLASSKTAPTTLTLQITRDAGESWQSIPLPARLQGVSPDSYEFPPSFAVSPLDANRVYLTTAAYLPSCPNRIGQEGAPSAQTAAHTTSSADAQPFSLTVPQPGGPLCFTQYVSGDGGATWHDLSLPASGLLGAPRGQGNRLWALISPPFLAQDTTAPAGHLARSADGGVTWTRADASLPSSVGIADFMPVPGGDTIFIVTDRADRFNSGVCQGCLPPPDYRLWRSGDLGAHWTQVSTLPYQDIGSIAIAAPASSATGSTAASPVVYVQVYTDGNGTLALVASTDGGQTWAPAPTSGIQNGSVQQEGIAGVLADGSAMIICAPSVGASTHTFYAYKPGDAGWRPVAPQLASLLITQVNVAAPAADGSQTVTLLYQDENGNRVATYQVH